MANVNITHITCCECGISFWVPTEFNQQLLKRQNTFYCPSGHPQSYTGKTDVQKAREARDRYKNCYEDEKEEKDRLARSNSALRGVITRQKKKK